MNNLIKIETLSKEERNSLVKLAEKYKSGYSSNHQNKHAALMFFENSTRTRFSFECAINRLGAHPYLFDYSKSSTMKGEELFDTLNNLGAIGINTFIIRTSEENLIENLINFPYQNCVHFINAGEGKASHPTQALLDYFTILEKLKQVKDKKVVIIGDIKHSRVAKSNAALLSKMGANVVLCAPEYFMEKIENASCEENLEKALKDADVVMCLRIQNERLEGKISKDNFIRHYQINLSNFPENAILMHPGPVNRNVEIQDDILNSQIGKTILQQAQNGVFIRMAVLDSIFREDNL